jgi:hypothetical protein
MSIGDRWMMRCQTRSFEIYEMCWLSSCDMKRLIWSPLAATVGSYALQAASDLGSSTVAQSSLQQASHCWNRWNPFKSHTSKTRGGRLSISQNDNHGRYSVERK